MEVMTMTTQTPTTAQTKPKRDGGVQPRKQANKARAVVQMRRNKIIKDVLAGKTHQESGVAAGFSPKTAAQQVSQTLRNPIVQNALRTALEKAGLTDEFLANKHRELLSAKRYIPARGNDEGSGSAQGYIEVDDFAAQVRALDITHKVAGRYVDRHEVDTKQPLQIVIKKFCSRGTPPQEGAPG